jgi:soluble lytic murein transglycosylase-like protein
MKFMKKPRTLLATTTALSLALAACATTGDEPLGEVPLELSPEPEARSPNDTPEKMLAALDEVAGSGRPAREIRDVRRILEAQIAAQKGDKAEAARLWFEAMGLAQGRFAKLAFEGWVKAYTDNLGRKADKLVLARLLLAETQSGNASKHMKSRNLTTDVALMPVLEQLLPDFLTPSEPGAAPATETSPPVAQGFPPEDLLLTDSAARHCKASKASVAEWQAWQSSLPEDVRKYWQGLVQQCAGQAAKALETLRDVYPRLGRNKATQALAVEAAGRVAVLERALDQKSNAADTYNTLMELYSLPGVTAKAMGLERLAFLLRRIDETLWAARYRATVGDYENAKRHGQAALDLINSASSEPDAQTDKRREELAVLRADSYHTLAYRIAVEKREYDSAVAMNTLALQSQYLTREWSERLQWFAGLYEYLAGNFPGARKRWEKLIASSDDDAMRAMASFWLARTLDKLGKKEAAAELVDAIVEAYPLSYYSVVAPYQAGMKPRRDWHETFGEPAALARNLYKSRSYRLDAVRRDAKLSVLMLRAEILVETRIEEWAKIAVSELEAAMTASLDPRRDVEAFVYLTRLQYNAGQFLANIALTTKLARANKGFWRDFPEQVLVYFPRPYRDTYVQNSIETSLDKELLLGISRQESGFTPNIRSSANAVGVMQLIHPTARRYAGSLGFGDQPLDELLVNPRANIRLGSRFLQHLSTTFKGFGPAIYGGYNAGEYAMKSWLQRRAHTDPLVFVELVPFGETKDYIKNVWRNLVVYRFVDRVGAEIARPSNDAGWRRADSRAGGLWTL